MSSLVFATGFEVGSNYSRRTGFEIIGRKGLTLTEKWRDGVRTVHGLSVRGFPNCFILSIAQSGFTVNLPYLLDVQARHAAWVIAWALRNDAIELEASTEAEDAWVRQVIDRSAASADRAKTCTPGYYNREGQANAKTRQGSFFYGTPTESGRQLHLHIGGRSTLGGQCRESARASMRLRRCASGGRAAVQRNDQC